MPHQKSSYRILGIDPGTAIVGWAILDVIEEKNEPSVVAYGHISTAPTDSDEIRLEEIASDLIKIIALHKPEAAAIEQLFFFKNQKTIITVAQARGVIVHTCHKKNLTVAHYTPLQIKQSLTGYGRADKKQIQKMIVKILNLTEIPEPDDTADALTVALCHANSYKFQKKLRTAS